MTARRFRISLVALTLFGGALRFYALSSGLPHPMTRPDEEAILAHTAPIARGEPNLEWMIYPSAYLYLTWAWGAGGLALGQAAHVFPPGSYIETLRQRPAELLIVGRTLSAAAGTAAIPLLAWAVRPTLGPGAALAAGAILASSLLHVRDSHALKPDALLTLAVVAALGFLARVVASPTPARAVPLGVAIGLGTAMKYPALLLLAAVWVATASESPARGWRRLLPAPFLISAAMAALTFLLLNPYLVLNPTARTAALRVFGSIFPGLFPALVSKDLPKSLGDLGPPKAWWEGFRYHAVFSLRYGAGLIPTLAIPVVLAWGLAHGDPFLRATVTFAGVWYLVNGLSPMILARYMTPLIPALGVLWAGSLFGLAARAGRWRRPVILLGLAFLSAESLTGAIASDLIAGRTDTRNLATAWLRTNLSPGSRVAIVGTRFWGYGEPIMPSGIEAVRVPQDARALPPGRVDAVLVHEHPTFASWVPAAQWAALAPSLESVAEFTPYRDSEAGATFEPLDAFYLPLGGFAGVYRPGPRIRVYRIRPGAGG